MSNKYDREKITFIQGFNNEDSKKISRKCPNAIVFSEPKKYKGIIYIKNIYKNNIPYISIQGIDPDNNKFIFNDNIISLDLDNKNSLLNLNKNEIEVKYFYIGFGDRKIFSKESSIIEFFGYYISNNDKYVDGGNEYQLFKNKLNNLFDNKEDKNSIIFYPAVPPTYLIIPVEWENHLKIYCNNINIGKYIFEIENVEQIQRNIILQDCKYNIYELSNYNTIKIEKSF